MFSPLNNFLKIPEIVIVSSVKYKKKWFNFAKIFWPRKALSLKFGMGVNNLNANLIRVIQNMTNPNNI